MYKMRKYGGNICSRAALRLFGHLVAVRLLRDFVAVRLVSHFVGLPLHLVAVIDLVSKQCLSSDSTAARIKRLILKTSLSFRFEAIATRLEAIAIRLETIASNWVGTLIGNLTV